jgi:hypothetical protein
MHGILCSANGNSGVQRVCELTLDAKGCESEPLLFAIR